MLELSILPVDPAIHDKRIVVPDLEWTEIERKFLETALDCAENMRNWWLKEQTAVMRKALDGNS